jgi:hypothetical protein
LISGTFRAEMRGFPVDTIPFPADDHLVEIRP